MFQVPEQYRVKCGIPMYDNATGNNGVFLIDTGTSNLRVIASEGEGWEHVSVSLPNRCPTWDEMCVVKDLFWSPEDAVMQIHPPASLYVNTHPYCLHLWRPNDGREIPLPHYATVGPLKGQSLKEAVQEYEKVYGR